MNRTNFKTGSKKPEIEINKPGASKFWQQPNFNLWTYLIFVVLSFYLWQGYLEAKKEEIPYSKFIAYVKKNEVAKAEVTDKYISGTLNLKDKTTNSPRRFITVPLLNLERASEIARAMVCQFGMSENLGPLTYGKRQKLMYLGVQGQEERNYSEETAKLIDSEVRTLVENAHKQATQILTKKRSTLDTLAKLLLEKEVLSGDEVAKITKKKSTPQGLKS